MYIQKRKKRVQATSGLGLLMQNAMNKYNTYKIAVNL